MPRFRSPSVLAAVLLAWCSPAPGAPAATGPLAGAIDVHCHTGPDALARSVDDVQLARLAREAGLRAIVLKNHYTATADRAALAMRAVPGIEVFGGVALNRAVGGINPEAVLRMVEMDGRRGKIVWLPTWDAAHVIRRAGESRPMVPVLHDGKPVPELAAVFRLAAEHELVIATGHASAEETLTLISAAHAAGVRHVLVTHALFPPLDAADAQLEEMTRRGAYLELVWLQHHPAPIPGQPPTRVVPPVPLDRSVALIRRLGPERIVIASDFGQASNPPPPEGLRAFVTALREAGIAESAIDRMVRRNPARLLGLESD